MTTIHKSMIVPYKASEVYALVNKIEEYPDFLPWCKSIEILSRSDEQMRATMVMSFGGLQKSITTCNHLKLNKSIKLTLEDGPFSHFEGGWNFETLEDGTCKVSLDLEFAVTGTLLSFAFEPIFHSTANTLIDAFRERAQVVYGENG